MSASPDIAAQFGTEIDPFLKVTSSAPYDLPDLSQVTLWTKLKGFLLLLLLALLVGLLLGNKKDAGQS